MADMQMQMLHRLGVTRFNLVNTDYTFWSSLGMLDEYGPGTIMR